MAAVASAASRAANVRREVTRKRLVNLIDDLRRACLVRSKPRRDKQKVTQPVLSVTQCGARGCVPVEIGKDLVLHLLIVVQRRNTSLSASAYRSRSVQRRSSEAAALKRMR